MKKLFSLLFFICLATAMFAGTKPEVKAPDVGVSFEYASPALAVTPADVPAEAPAVVNKYAYGFRHAVALTYSTTITVAPDNYTLTYGTLSVTGAATITATETNSIVGDQIYLQVTADGTNRALTFTGGITAATYTVTANKTVLLGFVYSGSQWYGTSVLQVN